ncbi:uncharacterized protein LOC120282806 [Dioscorea cayenensis subsp. rotundata]|uniref:Uncharacterized protein LOC120282806 n=1 Tax=Dioscorea cayennensis subsp. rotundata TaxID=55577 RepID=A0AB40CZP1_DIOCR|nr:uncharacterized protein LOC120282806 [Dioscorea cayenensis subsp. rotundata]
MEKEKEPQIEFIVSPIKESKPTPSVEKKMPPLVKEYVPCLLYPSRMKNDHIDEQFKRFLDLLKQFHIHVPFMKALSQIPKYAKFLKDLLTNQQKLEEVTTVTLSERSSVLLHNQLPRKQKDQRSFTILCNIGDLGDEKALADLGASINVMSFTMFRKLGLCDLNQTKMTLQLASDSIRHPRRIINDVLVKVDKFIFPVDFVILDADEDVEVPLILGRLFLATFKALIDVSKGKMTLRVGDEKVIFALSDAMKRPSTFDDTCYYIDGTESLVDECVRETLHKEPFEESLDGPHIEETTSLFKPAIIEEST